VPQLAITLPRWKFLVRTQLNDHLSAMGMPIAFDPTRADFSGMTADEALSIAAVLHQAFIAVDEEGTEAAAATAVVMTTVSMPQTTVFEVDRAFMFVIHDVETATPMFIGRIDDPAGGR
jgi:serpin B